MRRAIDTIQLETMSVKTLDSDDVYEVMKEIAVPLSRHDCLVSVVEFGGPDDRLDKHEFEKFYKKITQRSYLGSKWAILTLILFACHTYCCVLLFQLLLGALDFEFLLTLLIQHLNQPLLARRQLLLLHLSLRLCILQLVKDFFASLDLGR